MSDQDKALQSFYEYVQDHGNLRTEYHAKRWSNAVLRTMGFNMPGGARKKLGKELPAELSNSLTRGFKLLAFQNAKKPADEFFREVARRSGNSDPDFARMASLAVFGGLKQTISSDASRQVGDALPKAVGSLWDEA